MVEGTGLQGWWWALACLFLTIQSLTHSLMSLRRASGRGHAAGCAAGGRSPGRLPRENHLFC